MLNLEGPHRVLQVDESRVHSDSVYILLCSSYLCLLKCWTQVPTRFIQQSRV